MAEKNPVKSTLLKNDGLEFVNCNLCKSNDSRVVCHYGTVKIVKCKKCGLVYRNPRLKESLNRDFYSFDYYGEYEGTEERIAGARISLFTRALSHLEKKTRPGSRAILDIGCGQGHFLKFAKDSGWQVEGVELSGSACSFAKRELGLDIINKSVEEENFRENSFDVITLWNVLDHLCDPTATLKEIKRILKRDGILLVRFPNVDFHLFAHRLFSLLPLNPRNTKLSDPSVVTNYGFSGKTIKRMLEKCGFSKIEVSNSLVTSGDPYKSFAGFRDCTINMLKKTYFILSLIIYYLSFGRFTVGSSLLVLARNREYCDKTPGADKHLAI